MERAIKILTNVLVVTGLVFLSFRPSVTNRVEPLPSKMGPSFSTAAIPSSVGFPAKCSQYRGSFENNQKKFGGHFAQMCRGFSGGFSWRGCFGVRRIPFPALASSPPVFFRILRI